MQKNILYNELYKKEVCHMNKTDKKVVKSSIINISKTEASKEKNGVLGRAVFAKGDAWATNI